jgi:hypothetical protein
VTWVKLDDDFPDRDAVWRLSDHAFRLHVSALAFSNRLLLDGKIPAARLAGIVPNLEPAAIDELIQAGIWERDGATITIVDSLSDQPTKEKVLIRRKADATRLAAWRPGHRKPSRNGVTHTVSNGVGNGAPGPSPTYVGGDGARIETRPSSDTTTPTNTSWEEEHGLPRGTITTNPTWMKAYGRAQTNEPGAWRRLSEIEAQLVQEAKSAGAA